MNPERWARIKDLFLRALTLGALERDVFLDSECAGDPELADQVRLLLRASDTGSGSESSSAQPGDASARAPRSGSSVVPEPGSTLDDYRLEQRLGEGAMSIVQAAVDVRTGARVALKILRSELLGSTTQRERFRREARAVELLEHPHIVSVISIRDDRSPPYLVMPLIDGASLHDRLESTRSGEENGSAWPDSSSPARIDRAVRVAIEIGRALDHAHSRSVIHRDVKPHNIVIDSAGKSLLVDFGLAHLIDQADLTRTGQLFGTPYYMSPEQVLAQRVPVDHRTDVYSLGVVLYEMLTLQRPFRGDDARELLYSISFCEPESARKHNANVSLDLETIVIKAMAKRPADRYSTAREFVDDLERFRSNRRVLARRLGPVAQTTRHVERHKHAYANGALVSLSLALGLWLAIELPPSRASVLLAADSGATSGSVYRQRVDPATQVAEAPAYLGTLSSSPLHLVSGIWRILVVSPDELAYNELTCVLPDANARVIAPVRFVPTARAVRDMILVPAGWYRTGLRDAAPRFPRLAEREVELPAFWIDATEVTNAQFREFVEATGHRRPAHWSDGYSASWDELPVLGVEHSDAEAYARWMGKRLPTAIEWDAAMRGPDGWLYPWGDEPDVNRLRELASIGHVDPVPHPAWRGFDTGMTAVGAQRAIDRSVFGVLDGLGNAREWTESIFCGPFEDSSPSWGARVVKGLDWKTPVDPAHPEYTVLASLHETPVHAHDVGFRCAKSFRP